MPEGRNAQITIRIPRRIRELLERDAKDEQRSVADIANNLLASHYAKKKSARRA